MIGYFDYLCMAVRCRRHYQLLHELYRTTFYWFVEHDENRAEDGKMLRYFSTDAPGMDVPCTMLEMMIALCRGLAYELSGSENEQSPSDIFWQIIQNLGLYDLDDDNFFEMQGRYVVEDAISKVLDRWYEPDGTGGMFPLIEPKTDQRKVEIWYQGQAYICERYLGL